MNNFDLEDRLINFAILILEIAENLPNTKIGQHLENQLSRSGTSPALNYGEAQSAESRKDFIHKIKIILKELRETYICLRIIKLKSLIKMSDKLNFSIKECNELIAIFVTSYKTAKTNMNTEYRISNKECRSI